MLVTVVFLNGQCEAWHDAVSVNHLSPHTFEIVVRQNTQQTRIRITDVKTFLAGYSADPVNP